jgi:hypothetical protein
MKVKTGSAGSEYGPEKNPCKHDHEPDPKTTICRSRPDQLDQNLAYSKNL